MNIIIKRIPQKKFRPGIVGCDWWFDKNGNLQVRISDKLKGWRKVACIGLHEAVEAILCRHNGVSHLAVDRFDVRYEKRHPTKKIEAGDHPKAPYRREHCFATAVERMVAAELEVNWPEYDQDLENL